MALVLQLGADTSKFDRAMSQAKLSLVKHTGEMLSAVGSASGPLSVALNGIAGGGMLGPAAMTAGRFLLTYKAALLTTAAAVLALGSAIAIATDTIEKLEHIGAGAKAAGVGSDFFQTWTRAAEAAGIATADAEKALIAAREAVRTKMDKYGQTQGNDVVDLLGEQALGKGIGGKAYADLIASKDAEGRIKAVTEAIREYNRIVQEGGDSRLNLIGDELAKMTFGSAKFGEMIREAAGSMEALQVAGVASGVIFDRELVARAKELEKALASVKREIADGMIPVQRELASLGLDVEQGWIRTLAAVVEASKAVATFGGFLKNLLPDVAKLADDWRVLTGRDTAAMQGLKLLAANPQTNFPGKDLADKASFLSFGGRELLQPEMRGPAEGPNAPRRPPPSVLNEPPPKLKTSTPDAESLDQFDRYLEQLQKSVDVLNAEAASLGKSKAEKAQAIDMARAEAAARERGTELTVTERDEVKKLSAEKAQLNKVLDDYAKKQQEINALGGFVGNQLIDGLEAMIQSGGKLEDVLNNVVKALMRAALQAAILGQGPLAGLMGTAGVDGANGGLIGSFVKAFAGGMGGGSTPISDLSFRASGGDVQAGRDYLVGENGPEIARFGRNGSIVPHGLIGRGGGMGGGGGVDIHIENHGAKVETQTSRGADGRIMIREMIRAELASDVGGNGPIAQTLQRRYGLGRSAGARS